MSLNENENLSPNVQNAENVTSSEIVRQIEVCQRLRANKFMTDIHVDDNVLVDEEARLCKVLFFARL